MITTHLFFCSAPHILPLNSKRMMAIIFGAPYKYIILLTTPLCPSSAPVRTSHSVKQHRVDDESDVCVVWRQVLVYDFGISRAESGSVVIYRMICNHITRYRRPHIAMHSYCEDDCMFYLTRQGSRIWRTHTRCDERRHCIIYYIRYKMGKLIKKRY